MTQTTTPKPQNRRVKARKGAPGKKGQPTTRKADRAGNSRFTRPERKIGTNVGQAIREALAETEAAKTTNAAEAMRRMAGAK